MIFDLTKWEKSIAPDNAVAFFPVEANFSSQPATIAIDFSEIIANLSVGKTYSWSLILWRDDVISATVYDYTVHTIFVGGRLGNVPPPTFDANVGVDFGAGATSTTNPYTLSVNINLVSGKSISSSGKATLTLGGTSARDRTGKWKGYFAVLPSRTEQHGLKPITVCPTDFLTYTAVE